ncbi:hypothetical protein RJ641_000147 [Dillenia turbinata]|uniref:Uncharacterized protein n=1 Tax=Dillenia turbinata TaxID=194707 RepID=A0AAN8W5S4_9MAGN
MDLPPPIIGDHHHHHHPFYESSSFSSATSSRNQPIDLLEEAWFFGNSLVKNKSMSRCFSDPCPSLGLNRDMFVRSDSSRKNSSSTEDDFGDPLQVAKKEAGEEDAEIVQEKEENPQAIAFTPIDHVGFARPSLLRSPSLPPHIGKQKEIHTTNGIPMPRTKLTRRASMNSSEVFPPRQKGFPKHRGRNKVDLASMSTSSFNEMRRRFLTQSNTRKSLSDLECEEVQGFKDLGFRFEKEDLNPSVISILPGLKEKNHCESDEEDKVRRPYLSEAWIEQCTSPLIPGWIENKSAEDMKAQIKFWARAVASNVRAEC